MTNEKENIGGRAENRFQRYTTKDYIVSFRKIGVASRNIENNIKKLKKYGIIIRLGSQKNSYWEIVDKALQE